MISDAARYYGSFFSLLLEETNYAINIKKLSSYGTGFYLLDNSVPVYLKYSTKRKGPWVFNFLRSHQEGQQALFEAYRECFTCMICGRDGVAGLTLSEFRRVLDAQFEEQQCVSVRRRLKARYHIKGKGGELEKRIGRRSVFDKIIKSLEGTKQI